MRLNKTKTDTILKIYHDDLQYGDAIQICIRNPSYSNLLKSYGLFEELVIEELDKNRCIGIILDKEPVKEINDSGKVNVFINNESIYVHFSDFKKIT